MRPVIDPNNLYFSKQTVIHYTRANLLDSVFMCLIACAGIFYPLIQREKEWILFVSVVTLFYFGSKAYQQYLEIDEVQLILNSEGIKYRRAPLVPWDEIENISVYSEKVNDSTFYYFKFYCPKNDKVVKFNIGDLNIGPQDLEMAVRLHKGRFERAKTTAEETKN